MYEPNLKNFNDLYKDDMQEKRLNTINLNKYQNKVKKEPITCILVIDEVLREFLVKLSENVNIVL